MDQKEIALLKYHEITLFQDFIQKHWKTGHILSRELSIIDFLYKEKDHYSIMVAKLNSALIGMQCIIPLCHFDDQLPQNQIFLSLWKALEEKGIGTGFLIFKKILETYQPQFIASIGISIQAIPFHQWQKFTVGMMNHHVAFSPEKRKFVIAHLPKEFDKNFKKNNAAQKTYFMKLDEASLDNLDTHFLYLYQLPLKSNTFVKNRYMRNPFYQYDIFGIFKNNKICALCVIRSIIQDGITILRLIDFIGRTESVPLLKSFTVEILKNYDAEYIDFYSYGIPGELLEKAGFFDRHKISGLIVPNYFEPFERKNVDLAFAYKSNFPDRQTVRLFKGDSDQDRPNILKNYAISNENFLQS